MTGKEIISKIEALPVEEKDLVIDYLRKVNEELVAILGDKGLGHVSDSEFRRAQEQVSKKHPAILKKLAES